MRQVYFHIWFFLFFTNSIYADIHSVTGSDNNYQSGNQNTFQYNSNNKTIIINQSKPKNTVKHRSQTGIVTIKKSDGSVYIGQVLKGKKHGNGILTELCGAEYKGEWKNDKRNGIGYQTYCTAFKLNGNSYNGEWVNDFIQGYGTYTYGDGTTLTSDWVNGVPEGDCKKSYDEGHVFNGECYGFENMRGQINYKENVVFWGCLKLNNYSLDVMQDGFKRDSNGSFYHLNNSNEILLMGGEQYSTDPKIACPSWPP